MLFLGAFDYAMDERGRVPIPPRYRDAFRDGVVLGQGSPNPSVRIYTPEAWERHAARFLQQSSIRQRGMDLRLMLFSRAHSAALDAQNRLLVPGALRSYAGLENKVLLVGAGEFLELWSQENYDAAMARIEESLDVTLESIEEWDR